MAATKLEGTYLDEASAAVAAAVQESEANAYRILDAKLTSKISGGKVFREGVNSAVLAGTVAAFFTGAGSVFAGLHFMRGPAYGVQAICERYKKADEKFAFGERETHSNVVTIIKEGFTEWAGKLLGKNSHIKDRRQALATFARFTGLGVTSMLGGGAWTLEAATGLDLDGALEQALEKVKEYAGEVNEDVVAGSPVIQEPASGSAELPEAHVFKGEIPLGSRVKAGDGITYVLARVIKAHPERYGFDGDADYGAELHAKRVANMIAENAGQMRRWLTEKAVDKVNLFPEMVDGKWQLAALVDGKKMSMQDLADNGYTSTSPAASR